MSNIFHRFTGHEVIKHYDLSQELKNSTIIEKRRTKNKNIHKKGRRSLILSIV
jgi:hypothetical protein